MFYKSQHYSVKISVFFVALCEIAITQSCAEKLKATQRLNKSIRSPYYYCFSTYWLVTFFQFDVLKSYRTFKSQYVKIQLFVVRGMRTWKLYSDRKPIVFSIYWDEAWKIRCSIFKGLENLSLGHGSKEPRQPAKNHTINFKFDNCNKHVKIRYVIYLKR
jgi:hypothetical protein